MAVLQNGFSYWLMPKESDSIEYQLMSDFCCSALQAVALPLHITLFVGELSNNKHANQMLLDYGETLAATLGPQKLEYRQAVVKEVFGQSGYLSFSANNSIENLHQDCLNKFGGNYVLEPHLSLFYSNANIAHKRQVMNDVKVIKESIELSSLVLARHVVDIESAQDILNFEIVTRWPLSIK